MPSRGKTAKQNGGKLLATRTERLLQERGNECEGDTDINNHHSAKTTRHQPRSEEGKTDAKRV